MNVRVLLLLLLTSVVLAFMPRFRRIGLSLCVLWIALLLWVNVREAQLPDEPEPTRGDHTKPNATSSATQSRANIVDMRLEGRGAPWQLTGSVRNDSTSPIAWLRFNIERFDCPAIDSAMSDCRLIWQGEHIARIAITPGASGKLDESFYSHVAVPLQKGVLRDRIEVIDAG
jgi:hypothetical protein